MTIPEETSWAADDAALPANFIYALVAAQAGDAAQVLLAAKRSGLYRSDDAGRTWLDLFAALNLPEPLPALAVAASTDFRSDGTLFAGAPGNILRSGDGGASWRIVPLTSPPPVVSALVVSPGYVENGVVYAATTEDGVFRSGDRGYGWAAWNFGLLDLSVLCLAVTPGPGGEDTLFAGTESGIFRSTNGGRAWREVAFPVEWAPVLSLAVSPGYAGDGTLFAGTEEAGLFISRDRGVSWSPVGEGVVAGPVNALLLAPQSPVGAGLLVLAGSDLLLSRDGGSSFTALALPEGAEVVAVAAPDGLAPGRAICAGCADGEVLRFTL